MKFKRKQDAAQTSEDSEKLSPHATLARGFACQTIRLDGLFWEGLVALGCPSHVLVSWLAPCVFDLPAGRLVVPNRFYLDELPERAGRWLRPLFGGRMPVMTLAQPPRPARARRPPDGAGGGPGLAPGLSLLINGESYDAVVRRLWERRIGQRRLDETENTGRGD